MRYHPAALSDLARTPDIEAESLAVAGALDGQTVEAVIRLLESRSERNVFQVEKSHQRGTLRVLFCWGRGRGNLWMFGAYAKNNDLEGERKFRRIRTRVAEAESIDVEGVVENDQ